MAEESVHDYWREIPGWPGYRVSRDGKHVQSCKRTGYGNTITDTWRELKQRDDVRGYKSLGLKNVDRRTWIQVHVLVLMAWVGPRPHGMQGCHNNGNKHDNRLENLRWDTPKANAQDAIKHGTWTHGEKYHGSVLTDEVVARMYALLMEGRTAPAVARILGVKPATLHNVIRGVGWKHVPRPVGFDEFWANSAERGNKGRRKRIAKTCIECGGCFEVTPCQVKQRVRAKYCSVACYRQVQHRRKELSGAETAPK